MNNDQASYWETVIGLEVHIRLLTKTKLFSRASTGFGADPNSQVCGIDLGLPGILPVPNKEAFRMAIKFGLSINAEINKHSVFDRKNYFYPDLPKGYQISQNDEPIVKNGYITINLDDGSKKKINIVRAHIEEDAGKSIHSILNGMTGIDLNRAGTCLLEIVSAPELRSAKEAVSYLKNLHALVQYLEICDGNMQEGSFRCDANVSVRPKGQTEFGTRVEIKNINSFRFIERAINYEVERQIEVISNGGKIFLETRLYDAAKNETRSMRAKEEAHKYRYFPDPDLLPVIISSEEIEEIAKSLPELPWAKSIRLQNQYALSEYDANILVQDRQMAKYYEYALSIINTNLKDSDEETRKNAAKIIANWMIGELSAALNKANLNISESPIKTEDLVELVLRICDNTISGKIAKVVFDAMWNGEGSPDQIIEKRKLKQITDTSAIEKVIDQTLEKFPDQLQQYREGKDKLFGFFIGEVMKSSGGKANPQQLNEILRKKLTQN